MSVNLMRSNRENELLEFDLSHTSNEITSGIEWLFEANVVKKNLLQGVSREES